MSQNNNAEIIGRLTSDPKVGFTKSNQTPYGLFSIAVNESYKNRTTGQWENKEPMFVQVSTYNELAYYVGNILKKGMEVRVTGKARVNTYKDKSQLAIQADTVTVPLRTIAKVVGIPLYQAQQNGYGNGYGNQQGGYK